MLLQSHAGEIHLLPAPPSAWPDGSIKGLCARGAFEIDITWQSKKLSEAVLHSKLGHLCKVRYGDKVADVTIPAKGSAHLGPDPQTRRFA
jgi:alpha-L-fucosidase 2